MITLNFSHFESFKIIESYESYLFSSCWCSFTNFIPKIIEFVSSISFQGVITEGVINPRGIAVYPPEGLLAYSNWANQDVQHPHIGLSGMDGSDLKILVNTSIKWPNGLAFDMPSQRLFWGEAYYDLLAVSYTHLTLPTIYSV